MIQGKTMSKRILAVAAHPDDVEFMCAGTLIRLRDRGHSVTIATINSGSCGSAVQSAAEIAAVRLGEASRAAALIGAAYACIGIPDLESVFDNPTRRRVAELFRETQPDLVLTHYPQDYMPDHEIASLLARDATFTATLRNYPTGVAAPAPLLGHIPHLYYGSPLEGRTPLGDPVTLEQVVDVTAVMDRKLAMLCCHASQREWLRAQHGIDEYVDFARHESARMGADAGYRYGEAFRQHRGHAYPHDDLLTTLLKD
jgi:LmbE family N-acetylglucosaminyl deacetylase